MASRPDQRRKATRPVADLFVLVPGIMGSELRRGRRVVWGLDPRILIKQTLPFTNPLGELALDPEALGSDEDPPIVATGLLRFPGSLPGLTSLEPYTRMESRLKKLAGNDAAYLAFPYDWRRSIADAAAKLETAIDERVAQLKAGRDDEVGIVLVCHSMGGLVGRYFIEVLGAHDLVKHFITLGTPFAGSVKAMRVLATGGAIGIGPVSLFAKSIRDAASTMPGLHELMPRHPCVEISGPSDEEALRALTTAEKIELGANEALVEQAESTFGTIEYAIRSRGGAFARHRPVVGLKQPTLNRVRNLGDTPKFLSDPVGDGTVTQASASPRGTDPAYYPQRHGALADTEEVFTAISAIVSEESLGRPLGDEIGMDVPDVAVVGQSFDVRLIADTDPFSTASIFDASTGHLVAQKLTEDTSGVVSAMFVVNEPGLYRVELQGGGFSPVRENLWVIPKEAS